MTEMHPATPSEPTEQPTTKPKWRLLRSWLGLTPEQNARRAGAHRSMPAEKLAILAALVLTGGLASCGKDELSYSAEQLQSCLAMGYSKMEAPDCAKRDEASIQRAANGDSATYVSGPDLADRVQEQLDAQGEQLGGITCPSAAEEDVRAPGTMECDVHDLGNGYSGTVVVTVNADGVPTAIDPPR
jgi:hypothetical protein